MTSPASQDELADLRRRAYGPGAAADEADLDRLQRLEDARRDRTPGLDVVAAPGAAESAASDDVVTEPSGPPPAGAASGRVRRRRLVPVLIAIAVVAAIVAATWLLTRSDATILRRVETNDTAVQRPLASSLRTYGLDPDSYVQFESFEGLAVWTARIPDRGVRCLLILDESSVSVTYNGVVGWSCTPDGLSPSVDVVQFATGSELGSRSVGSVARFVFLGDRVEATVAEARGETVVPSEAPD